MATLLRWLALAAPLLTACGEEVAGPPDDLGPPLSGVVPAAPLPTAAWLFPVDPVDPVELSCITRYDFTSRYADVECLTEYVDGDPLHWTTTCPGPEDDELIDQVEVLVDEGGRRLFDAAREDIREWTRTLTYDDLDRLTEIAIEVENDASGDSVITFTDFNERGQPLRMTRTGEERDLGSYSFPANDEYGSYTYDALGRLTDHEVRYVANDATALDIHIVYDDAARRRYWTAKSDTSSFDNSAGAGESRWSELFDEEDRIVEWEWSWRPADEQVTHESKFWRYRYDEEGRLLTTVYEERYYGTEFQYTAHEVYDCP